MMRCKVQTRKLPVIVLLIFLFFAFSFSNAWILKVYADVPEVWHEIRDADDLRAIDDDLTQNYKLMADIDLSGNWEPLGVFTGKLDGNGKVIRNLTIIQTATPGKGLFTSIGAEGRVSNLGIVSASVTAGNEAGILAGSNAGTLERCYTKGTITGGSNVGGLVGSNTGTLQDCYTQAAVSGRENFGGLTGYNTGDVLNCYAASTMTPPVFNHFVKFDGSANGLIVIPHQDRYTNNNAFTLEAWFQWDDVDKDNVGFIIGKGTEQFEIHTGGGSGVNGLRFIPVPNVLLNADSYLDAHNVIQTGWFHVAAVYEYSGGVASARVYVNGNPQILYQNSIPVGTTVTLSRDENPMVTNTYPIYIGRRYDNTTPYPFKGKIADVRFWNTARTEDQIRAHKDAALLGNEPGLVGYWKLNEADGLALDSARDDQGNLYGNAGTLSSGAIRVSEEAAAFTGGLIGKNELAADRQVSNSFYDATLSSQNDEGKGEPRATGDMKQQSTFSGWDFDNVWRIDSSYPCLRSSAKDITSFSFNGLAPAVSGQIDEGTKTITATVPYGTDVTSLIPAIAHSGISISLSEAQDFSGPVSYTVTAEDNTTKTYDVAVTVAPNQAPLLDTANNTTLPAVVEDDFNPGGMRVSDLISGIVTNAEGASNLGIAIASADNAHGSWEYTLNGVDWQSVGAVSSNAALRLFSDAVTRIRFVPDAEYYGTASFSFRAWDRTDGGVNGSAGDVTTNGGSTAYSTGSEIASISILPVNDVPSFSKGADQTVESFWGAQTITGWASGISAGPANEAAQTLSFAVSNDNAALFAVQPSVSSNGTLTYTPAANASGTAVVLARLQDNGGTANGGVDQSPVQTFTITVHAPDANYSFIESFNGSKSQAWRIQNGDAAKWSLTENNGSLRIYTTPTDTYSAVNNLVNLFYIPLPVGFDNYQVTARISFPTQPSANFQMGGVVLLGDNAGQPDQNNLIRMEYVYSVQRRFETQYEMNGAAANTWSPAIDLDSGSSYWVRIKKEGLDYTTYYSLDGIAFEQLLQRQSTMTIAYAGVFALHNINTTASIPFDFDSFQVQTLAGIAHEETNASISAAKALIPANFTAVEGTHDNLLSYLNALPGMDESGVTLTLTSSNANVANNGHITYGSSAVTNNVVVHINKVGGDEDTTTIAVTVPARAVNSQDNDDGDEQSNLGTGSVVTGQTPVVILVNGQTQPFATGTTTRSGDEVTTAITLDETKLKAKLDAEGDKPVVVIPVSSPSDVIIGSLSGQTVKNMESREAVLEVQTPLATYTLPAQQINIDAVSGLLGSQVALKDITVQIRIAESGKETARIVEEAANRGQYQVIVRPVDFEITCTLGEKTVDVSRFNAYVERLVPVPEGIDPSRITTGVVLNEDGTFSHVPTTILVINGKYYAKINSLTNSTYSVIWNPVDFKDIQGHWAEADIEDMASRLIVEAYGNKAYHPDGLATRAEYIAATVRALGLMRPGTGRDAFADVKKGTRYYDAVSIAYDNKMVYGYGNGLFGVGDTITREQAMTILAHAMKLTGLKLSPFDTGKTLAPYTDRDKIASWARESYAACLWAGIAPAPVHGILVPKQAITRAEMAVLIRRLLQKSNLIEPDQDL